MEKHGKTKKSSIKDNWKKLRDRGRWKSRKLDSCRINYSRLLKK